MVLTDYLRHGALSQLPRIPLSQGSVWQWRRCQKAQSHCQLQASGRVFLLFFFEEDPRLCLMTVVSTPAAVGNYPACHEKGNTYPSTLLMRGNKDIFEWPVSLKLSNSNCFPPPQKQETSRQCFPFVF